MELPGRPYLFSFFLYMASMRWVTRKPPKMFTVARTSAQKPEAAWATRSMAPACRLPCADADGEQRADDDHRGDGVGHRHQRRVQRRRHAPDHVIADEDRQHEDRQAEDERVDDAAGRAGCRGDNKSAARSRLLRPTRTGRSCPPKEKPWRKCIVGRQLRTRHGCPSPGGRAPPSGWVRGVPLSKSCASTTSPHRRAAPLSRRGEGPPRMQSLAQISMARCARVAGVLSCLWRAGSDARPRRRGSAAVALDDLVVPVDGERAVLSCRSAAR